MKTDQEILHHIQNEERSSKVNKETSASISILTEENEFAYKIS